MTSINIKCLKKQLELGLTLFFNLMNTVDLPISYLMKYFTLHHKNKHLLISHRFLSISYQRYEKDTEMFLTIKLPE